MNNTWAMAIGALAVVLALGVRLFAFPTGTEGFILHGAFILSIALMLVALIRLIVFGFHPGDLPP